MIIVFWCILMRNIYVLNYIYCFIFFSSSNWCRLIMYNIILNWNDRFTALVIMAIKMRMFRVCDIVYDYVRLWHGDFILFSSWIQVYLSYKMVYDLCFLFFYGTAPCPFYIKYAPIYQRKDKTKNFNINWQQ